MGYYFLAILAILPFAQAANTMHGFPLYDPVKYQCKVVHGGFTEWSCFGPCSVSCGTGYQTRHRHCAAPVAKYGGNPCTGNKVEAKECDTKLKCPVNGGWSTHVKGECTKTCGGGVLTYRRYCNNPKPSHCGKDCAGAHVRTEACNTHQCPGWGPWVCTDCYKLKGKCQKKCTRTCKYHLAGNHHCTGNSMEYKPCAHNQCKPDIPPKGECGFCQAKAEEKANTKGYGADFVGLACRATDLKDFCQNNKDSQSTNGGLPAKNWFWIHCSPDGPWCKPCATRGLVFNKKCDACEVTRDGPCTKKDSLSDDDLFNNMENDDNW